MYEVIKEYLNAEVRRATIAKKKREAELRWAAQWLHPTTLPWFDERGDVYMPSKKSDNKENRPAGVVEANGKREQLFRPRFQRKEDVDDRLFYLQSKDTTWLQAVAALDQAKLAVEVAALAKESLLPAGAPAAPAAAPVVAPVAPSAPVSAPAVAAAVDAAPEADVDEYADVCMGDDVLAALVYPSAVPAAALVRRARWFEFVPKISPCLKTAKVRLLPRLAPSLVVVVVVA